MGNITNTNKSVRGKYLTFKLGKEEYGVAITKVIEIIGMKEITAIPERESFISGVINLRDKVIPIADLRKKFSMPHAEHSERSCIIITEICSSEMKKCWEEKQCGKESCPACGNLDNRCWLMAGTHCRNEIQGSYHEKIEACVKCDYYAEMHHSRSVSTVGMIVDSVSEVVSIAKKDVEEPLPFEERTTASDYISGIAKNEKGIQILLNIDNVFART